jgi:hypothetical protein
LLQHDSNRHLPWPTTCCLKVLPVQQHVQVYTARHEK